MDNQHLLEVKWNKIMKTNERLMVHCIMVQALKYSFQEGQALFIKPHCTLQGDDFYLIMQVSCQ